MSNLHLYTDEQLIQQGKRLDYLIKEAVKQDLVNTLYDMGVFLNAQLTLKAMRKEYKKRIKK